MRRTLDCFQLLFLFCFFISLPVSSTLVLDLTNIAMVDDVTLNEQHYVRTSLLLLGLLFGYVVFKLMPSFLKKRMLKRTELYKKGGFTPQCEVVSETYTSYLGVDLEAKKILYLDKKKASFIDFDKLNSWELEPENKTITALRLLTLIPSLPVIHLPIASRKKDEWAANLGMVFS